MLRPHEQRVVDEHKDLVEKLLKLEQFIAKNPNYARLAREDQTLLRMQLGYMNDYASILISRIARFPRGVN